MHALLERGRVAEIVLMHVHEAEPLCGEKLQDVPPTIPLEHVERPLDRHGPSLVRRARRERRVG
jgi:hypothetical protein